MVTKHCNYMARWVVMVSPLCSLLSHGGPGAIRPPGQQPNHYPASRSACTAESTAETSARRARKFTAVLWDNCLQSDRKVKLKVNRSHPKTMPKYGNIWLFRCEVFWVSYLSKGYLRNFMARKLGTDFCDIFNHRIAKRVSYFWLCVQLLCFLCATSVNILRA